MQHPDPDGRQLGGGATLDASTDRWPEARRAYLETQFRETQDRGNRQSGRSSERHPDRQRLQRRVQRSSYMG